MSTNQFSFLILQFMGLMRYYYIPWRKLTPISGHTSSSDIYEKSQIESETATETERDRQKQIQTDRDSDKDRDRETEREGERESQKRKKIFLKRYRESGSHHLSLVWPINVCVEEIYSVQFSAGFYQKAMKVDQIPFNAILKATFGFCR